jgi:hypothetical protein
MGPGGSGFHVFRPARHQGTCLPGPTGGVRLSAATGNKKQGKTGNHQGRYRSVQEAFHSHWDLKFYLRLHKAITLKANLFILSR